MALQISISIMTLDVFTSKWHPLMDLSLLVVAVLWVFSHPLISLVRLRLKIGMKDFLKYWKSTRIALWESDQQTLVAQWNCGPK
jgi:hypothetical protein